ncbi:hypothetical protein AHMF7605_29285 [Adhaeribacter arboris]|uniref:Uncharacterized protein n=1 Tax=Adhaeribacter arboris TaxID=2072846 RepID=A0A2T2Y8Z9_9BACT|nr:hypothetical protein [Adhaeribacter arboris]PSR52001.1 hypothetical protein AHMF7605_29285 [Adhaeribacter arboris]
MTAAIFWAAVPIPSLAAIKPKLRKAPRLLGGEVKGDGTKEWDKTIGSSGFDDFRSLQQTSDGGYILAVFPFPA